MKNRIFYLTFFLFLFKLNFLYAQVQNNYFVTEQLPLDESMVASIELPDGNILAVYNKIIASQSTYSSIPEFVIINNSGNIIQSHIIDDDFDFVRFYFLKSIEDDEFIAVGYGGYQGSNGYPLDTAYICYYRFNFNFELLSKKTFYFQNNFIAMGGFNITEKKNGNFLISADLVEPPYVLKIYEITKLGDSVGVYEITKPMPNYNNCFGLTQKHDESGYYMLVYGFWEESGGYNSFNNIAHLNNEFQNSGRDSLPGQCAWLGRIQKFTHNTYLVAGNSFYTWWVNSPGNPHSEAVSSFLIQTLDTSLQVINQSIPSIIAPKDNLDTILYPALYKPFDYIDTNNIYASYGFFPYESGFPSTPFIIVRYDKNLNILWQYIISGEGYYMPHNVMATQDGGVFVSGFRSMSFDWRFDDYFYLRTDSTGLILGSSIPGLQMHSATAYPNPGSDKLILLTGPQIEGALLQIYDMNGRQIFKDKLKNQTTEINTNNWKSGSYPWCIIHNGKVVDEGVWVKQ